MADDGGNGGGGDGGYGDNGGGCSENGEKWKSNRFKEIESIQF